MKRRQHTDTGRRHRRTGSLILEVVMVTALAAVLLGLSAASLHSLLRTRRDSHHDAWHARSVARLAHLFRSDVHGAIAGAVEDQEKGPILTLTGADGGRVRFEVDGNLVHRLATNADREHRDTFHAAKGAHFDLQADGRAIRLSLERPAAKGPNVAGANQLSVAHRRVVFLASLARDHRHDASLTPADVTAADRKATQE